jgi:hypothetical protein
VEQEAWLEKPVGQLPLYSEAMRAWDERVPVGRCVQRRELFIHCPWCSCCRTATWWSSATVNHQARVRLLHLSNPSGFSLLEAVRMIKMLKKAVHEAADALLDQMSAELRAVSTR